MDPHEVTWGDDVMVLGTRPHRLGCARLPRGRSGCEALPASMIACGDAPLASWSGCFGEMRRDGQG